jgi:hypothetical protein
LIVRMKYRTAAKHAMSARARPRVLIYKRNNAGDSESRGTFGCHDCIGKIRVYRYDALIGIEVSQRWPGDGGAAELTDAMAAMSVLIKRKSSELGIRQGP